MVKPKSIKAINNQTQDGEQEAQKKVVKPKNIKAIKEQTQDGEQEAKKKVVKPRSIKAIKEPKTLILQNDKEAKFLEKSKLRQLKDAERIYNTAIKALQR